MNRELLPKRMDRETDAPPPRWGYHVPVPQKALGCNGTSMHQSPLRVPTLYQARLMHYDDNTDKPRATGTRATRPAATRREAGARRKARMITAGG